MFDNTISILLPTHFCTACYWPDTLHCSQEQVYNSKPIAEENSVKPALSPVIRAAQTLNPNGLNNGDRLGQKPEP